MWTAENRHRYDRDKLRYPSDLTDAEWQLIKRKRDFRYTRWPAGWSVMLASGEPGLSQ